MPQINNLYFIIIQIEIRLRLGGSQKKLMIIINGEYKSVNFKYYKVNGVIGIFGKPEKKVIQKSGFVKILKLLSNSTLHLIPESMQTITFCVWRFCW